MGANPIGRDLDLPPDIAGLRVERVFDHFRCHPRVRASRTHPGRVADLASQAEVGDLQRVVVQVIVLDGFLQQNCDNDNKTETQIS